MGDRYLGMDFTGLSFVEEQKLKGFFHKFTEEYYNEYKIGHIIFAAYAAVPSYINPDLLYKIWMNFKEYEWKNVSEQVHLVAVVDLINASFCEEIGPKLYKLNTGIKNALNEWLKNEVNQNLKKNASENDIAHFINAELKHVQKDYKLWGGDEYVFDQSLNADLLVYPERAMEKIKQVLYQAKSDTEKLLAFNLLVDAKKKISTEINFDEITELGKDWKEYLLGRPTEFLKKLESLESSFLKDEPVSSLSMEITIPQEIVKEQTAQKKRKRIYGVLVGIDEYEDKSISSLENCVKNAKSLHDLLKNNIDYKKNRIDFNLVINEKATISRFEDYLDELENLDDGDTFILYYSGHAQDVESLNGEGRDLVFYDSVFVNTKTNGYYDHIIRQNDLEDYIYKIIKEKNIHCVLIFDCSDAIEEHKSELYENKLRKDDDLKSSFIILDSTASGENAYNYELNARFTDTLLDVLKEGGFYMSYHEIYEKLRLNILQQNASQRKEHIPRIEAFPPDYLHLKFLNNTENLYDNLEIYFNEKRTQWEVNAGFNKGINSSIPLMPTILETDLDGKKFKWQVKKNYLNYASLEDFKGDTNQKFKAKLLQNSLRGILFFIDVKEQYDEKLKHEFKGFLERRGVPLIEITEDELEAKYVISSNNILGFFVFDPLFGEFSMIMSSHNIEEFITHLEYLAQWEGLLQYSNLNSKLNPKDFKWGFSLINQKRLFSNLTNIDIHVKKDYARKSFNKIVQNKVLETDNLEVKCIVTFKDSSNKGIKEEFWITKDNGRNPGINFELFKGIENSGYGLSMLVLDENLSIEEVEIYDTANVSLREINYDFINTVRSKLKKSKQLYLKIFLSNQPLNFKPFLQEGTNKDLESKSSSFLGKEIFDATEVDWISYTIPINVTLKEGRAGTELKVEQFTENRKVKIDDNELGKIRDLIDGGRLEKAIGKLEEYLEGKRSDKTKTLLLIKSRFKSIDRRDSQGTVSQNENIVERNTIRNSLLSLLDELDKDNQNFEL